MDVNREKISVVIPSYNAAGMIEEAVASVLAQTWPNIECVVVDDGSTDGTEAALKPYKDRIRYIKKPNGGFASARNLGMERASGEFIAWLDADDIFEPSKLERQMALFDVCPDLGLVCSDFKMFDETGVFRESALRFYYGVLERGLSFEEIFQSEKVLENGDHCWHGRILNSLLKGNFVHPPTVLFRRAVFTNVGPQNVSLGNATDYEYLSRIACKYSVGLVNEPLLRYRISEGQSSSPKNFAKNARFTELALRHMKENFPLDGLQAALMAGRILAIQLTTARHLADESKLAALRCFWTAQVGQRITRKSVVVFFKILTPKFVIRWRRALLPNKQHHGF
tara:strand:+ start:78158 stop:79174 length:1017 start_codon:yes stop_codon:yes gene_type:complete